MKKYDPGIDQMTENSNKRCKPRQALTPQFKYEPLRMTPLPDEPNGELSTDVYDPPIQRLLRDSDHRRLFTIRSCRVCQIHERCNSGDRQYLCYVRCPR